MKPLNDCGAPKFVGAQYDSRYMGPVGWDQSAVGAGYRYFFSDVNMALVSSRVTDILSQYGYDVRMTPRTIGGVMSDVFKNNNPKIGDIRTRYVIPDAKPRNDVENLTEQAINILVNAYLDEQDTLKINSSLSVWTTVLGDFNGEGLRAHPILKTKENDYIKGVFMENY